MRKYPHTYLSHMSLLCSSIALRVLSLESNLSPAVFRVSRRRLISSWDVFAAATLGNTLVLDRMIAAGADIDISWEGFTPLMGAALEGQIWTLKHLLESKANPNRRHPTGLSPLLCAIRARNPECVRLLLAHKANPGPLRKGDLAPLRLAQLMGNEFITRMIREALESRRINAPT